MSFTGPITQWIDQLKGGNASAAEKLWEQYFQRLVQLARKKLQGTARRMADEEDVALCAFDSFCRGAVEGRFPKLRDHHNLWPLLVVITERKALDQVQHNLRQKRGSGQVQGESVLLAAADSRPAGLDQFPGQEPTPEFAAQVADECQRLLERLPDPELRTIALWKMEGYTNAEIADRLGCVVVTVERRLRLIRSFWEQEKP